MLYYQGIRKAVIEKQVLRESLCILEFELGE